MLQFACSTPYHGRASEGSAAFFNDTMPLGSPWRLTAVNAPERLHGDVSTADNMRAMRQFTTRIGMCSRDVMVFLVTTRILMYVGRRKRYRPCFIFGMSALLSGAWKLPVHKLLSSRYLSGSWRERATLSLLGEFGHYLGRSGSLVDRCCIVHISARSLSLAGETRLGGPTAGSCSTTLAWELVMSCRQCSLANSC